MRDYQDGTSGYRTGWESEYAGLQVIHYHKMKMDGNYAQLDRVEEGASRSNGGTQVRSLTQFFFFIHAIITQD